MDINKFNANFFSNNQQETIIIECTPKVIVINAQQIWKIEDIIEVTYFNNTATLLNNNGQKITIENTHLFNSYAKKYYKAFKPFNPKKYWFYKHQVAILFIIIAAFILITFIFSFIIIKNNAHKIISIEKEQQLGEILYKNTIKEYTVKDSASIYLQKFFNHINWKSNFNTKIIVVKSNETNAFAMPGGYIFVYDSIIKKTKNYEQLAGLLGHEFSHIQLRHALRSVINNMSTILICNFILGDWNKISQLLINFNSLKYSRNLEKEADENATILLTQKQINPLALFSLFKEMNKKNATDIPEFLNTHPNFKNREENIQNIVKNKNYNVKKNIELEKMYQQLKNSL